MARRGRPPTRPPQRRAKGDGSLYHDPRRDRWIGEVTVNRAGRRVRRRVSGRTREAAAAELRRLVADTAVVRLDGRSTVATIAAEWSDAYQRTDTRGITTVSVRLARVRHHIIDDPTIAAIPIAHLGPADVERWLHTKIAAGWTAPDHTQRRYSRATIDSIRGDLTQIVAWAVLRRITDHNPVPIADVAAVAAGAPKRTLTNSQAVALVAACLEPRPWGTLVLTCLLLGARPGEAAGLRWDRIDHDAGTIRIDTAMKRHSGGRPAELGPVKTGQSRTVAAHPLLLDALRAGRAVQAEHRLLLGPRWPRKWDGVVFVCDDGHPPNASTLRRALRRIAAAAKLDIDDLTVYELRHSYASLLDAAGVPVRDITDALGHRDDRMFYTHYRHRPDPIVRAGTEAWGRIVSADRAEQQ